ncbi:MAG TPA: hypothetical protein ENF92_04210 [Desulfobacteraceae bacterium]|nr:hypothetical protein [Desulfobacteraceae bacterium]
MGAVMGSKNLNAISINAPVIGYFPLLMNLNLAKFTHWKCSNGTQASNYYWQL